MFYIFYIFNNNNIKNYIYVYITINIYIYILYIIIIYISIYIYIYIVICWLVFKKNFVLKSIIRFQNLGVSASPNLCLS